MERSLVERAQPGDREAFTSLAFALSDRLFAVAQRILRDFDSAGDVLVNDLLLAAVVVDVAEISDTDLENLRSLAEWMDERAE